MGTRKISEQNIRSITQNSTGTYSVSLPISLVQEMRLKRRQKVSVRRQGRKIVIET